MKNFLIAVFIIVFVVLIGVVLLRGCLVPPPTPTPIVTETVVVITPTKWVTLEPTKTPVPPTLTFTPEPTNTKTPVPPTLVPPQKTAYAIDIYGYDGQVWFRAGPSQNFAPVSPNAVLTSGDDFEIVDCYNPSGTFFDWVEVTKNRIAGYVFGQFVKPYPCDN